MIGAERSADHEASVRSLLRTILWLMDERTVAVRSMRIAPDRKAAAQLCGEERRWTAPLRRPAFKGAKAVALEKTLVDERASVLGHSSL